MKALWICAELPSSGARSASSRSIRPAPGRRGRRRASRRRSGWTPARCSILCGGGFAQRRPSRAEGRARAGLEDGTPSRFLDAGQERRGPAPWIRAASAPDALGLAFALWSRPAVQALIEQRCDVRLAVRTTETYLARWGFTAQKPLRPRLRTASLRGQAMVAPRSIPRSWHRPSGRTASSCGGYETGLRSDDVRGRSYAPRGETPTVRPSHKRAGLGLISAISNKGVLRWMVLERAITAAVPDHLPFPPDPRRGPEGVPDPRPAAGASCPGGAGLAGRAAGPDRGVLPAALQPRAEPGRG